MTKQLFVDLEEVGSITVLGSEMSFLVDIDQSGGGYEVVLVESRGGGDLLPHRHPWEEMYFVIDGTMEVQVGRVRRTVTAGSVVTLPARCLHAYRVLSESARFLHVSLGRGAVDAFRDMAAELPPEPTPDDAEIVLDVLGRHGIELVLPEGVSS